MIEPALSAKEWADVFADAAHPWANGDVRKTNTVFEGADFPEDSHYIAALALHGQPFGFTWEDVARLRGLADWYEDHTKESVVACPVEHLPGWQLRNIADRIEALLPPREPRT